MKDEIPFNDWSRERIKTHNKICTSRHQKYTKDKRVFKIYPKTPWGIIRDFMWREEGAESSAELQKVIEDIYKREVPDDEMFYPHFGNFKPLASELRHDRQHENMTKEEYKGEKTKNG